MDDKQFDGKKFNFSELFNNNSGQTAIALITAFIVVCTGCLSFAYCIFFAKGKFLTECSSLTGIGVSIYLGRNIKDAFKK